MVTLSRATRRNIHRAADVFFGVLAVAVLSTCTAVAVNDAFDRFSTPVAIGCLAAILLSGAIIARGADGILRAILTYIDKRPKGRRKEAGR